MKTSNTVESVDRISDSSHGMVRVEVVCKNVSIFYSSHPSEDEFILIVLLEFNYVPV